MKSLREIRCALLSAAVLLAPVSTVNASEGEHREHEAHEHGRGLLNVVVDGNELAIEFEIPAANVVGFEHPPGNEEEKHAVEEALELFGRPDALFVPSADAECLVERADVALGGLEHGRGEHQEDEQSEHDEKPEHSEHEDEMHSELHAEYVFHCQAPQALDSLEVRLFDYLRDVEEIDVQLVTPTIQTAMELRMKSNVIELARK